MNIFSLATTVLIGVLFFIAFFHLSNFLLDYFRIKAARKFALENSIRVIIFIGPAFIVLFVFIIYPVFETIRLSFYDKQGENFVGYITMLGL
ncbi:MAG: hypothetical protein CM15mP110_5170 [Alphaproteobacteria bacterium]|nr:MAG: hypothetical protein CM15mP110_5170 [Alphaproteobacteria bacterium]